MNFLIIFTINIIILFIILLAWARGKNQVKEKSQSIKEAKE